MPMLSYATVTVTVELTRVSVVDGQYGDAVAEALAKAKVDPACGKVTAVTVRKT
jgi:hypothetical protein